MSMTGPVGEFDRVVGGGSVKIPTGRVAVFGKIRLVVAAGTNPRGRWSGLRLPVNATFDIGDGPDAGIGRERDGDEAFSQGTEVKMGIDETGQDRLPLQIYHPGLGRQEIAKGIDLADSMDLSLLDQDGIPPGMQRIHAKNIPIF